MNTITTGERLHRLLFRALLEIRAEAAEQRNKLGFHLADLFHNVVLDMEAAAEGRLTYEEAMGRLQEKAKEKKCERWLTSALEQIGSSAAPATFVPGERQG